MRPRPLKRPLPGKASRTPAALCARRLSFAAHRHPRRRRGHGQSVAIDIGKAFAGYTGTPSFKASNIVNDTVTGVPYRVSDNTRPPRNLVDPDRRPTLGVKAVMSAVEELAKARGIVGFRVAYKRNPAEEHVVALIFPSHPTAP
jgi:hypothetical protein